MVLIMTTSWVPQGKEMLVGEKYLDVMREVPGEKYEKSVLPLGVVSTKEGTKVISIVQVKEGLYEKAINRITKRLLKLSAIEGIRYQIETLLSGKEALSLIGLDVPQQMAF